MNDVVNYLMVPVPLRFAEVFIMSTACEASNSENFFEKHFAPAGYGALAWIQSLIDLPIMAVNTVTWSAIIIIDPSNEEMLQAFICYIGATIQSALYLILLPLLILSGIFLPDETWGALDLDF